MNASSANGTLAARLRAARATGPDVCVAVTGHEYVPGPAIKGRKPLRVQRQQRRFWRLVQLGVRP